MAPTSRPFVIEHPKQALLLHDLARTFPGTRPSQYLLSGTVEFQFDLAVAAVGWERDRKSASGEAEANILEW
jgi:hypothetical protein